ncbi:MAG: nucleotidyltransferase substrate binding protein [Selenomonadaceae bacterium]|nr:nucleotidyltransferase substrate binding protein [Selenomonadaceae bacterium]
MKKVENFFRALKNLKEIEGKEPPFDTISLTGMVSLFEICFEQSWKAMKEQLEACGYGGHKTGSPKAVIKLAYQSEMIDDEASWLAALQARNNVAHSYNESIALSIIRESQEIYIEMFEKLQKELQENWM